MSSFRCCTSAVPSFPASSMRRSVSARWASKARRACSGEAPGPRAKWLLSKAENRRWAGPGGLVTKGSLAAGVALSAESDVAMVKEGVTGDGRRSNLRDCCDHPGRVATGGGRECNFPGSAGLSRAMPSEGRPGCLRVGIRRENYGDCKRDGELKKRRSRAEWRTWWLL